MPPKASLKPKQESVDLTPQNTKRVSVIPSKQKDYVVSYGTKTRNANEPLSPTSKEQQQTTASNSTTPNRRVIVIKQSTSDTPDKKRKTTDDDDLEVGVETTTTTTSQITPLSKKSKQDHNKNTPNKEDAPETSTTTPIRPLKLTIKLGGSSAAGGGSTTPIKKEEEFAKEKSPPKSNGKKKEETPTTPASSSKKVITIKRELPPYKSLMPSAPQPTPDQLSAIKKHFVNIISQLVKKDEQGFFLNPVTEDIAPNYFTHIREPMDFVTMRKKNNEGKYWSIEQFQYDFILICENCMRYNTPESIFYKEARKLLTSGKNLIASYTSKVHPERLEGTKPEAITVTPSASTLREKNKPATPSHHHHHHHHSSSKKSTAPTPEPVNLALSAPKPIGVTRTKSKPPTNMQPPSTPLQQPQTPMRMGSSMGYPTTPAPGGRFMSNGNLMVQHYGSNPMFSPALQQQFSAQQQQQQQLAAQQQQQQQQLFSALQSTNISLPKRKYVKIGAVGEVGAKTQSIPPSVKPSHSLMKSVAEGSTLGVFHPPTEEHPSSNSIAYNMYVPRAKNTFIAGPYDIVNTESPLPLFLNKVVGYQQQRKLDMEKLILLQKQHAEYQRQQLEFQRQQALLLQQATSTNSTSATEVLNNALAAQQNGEHTNNTDKDENMEESSEAGAETPSTTNTTGTVNTPIPVTSPLAISTPPLTSTSTPPVESAAVSNAQPQQSITAMVVEEPRTVPQDRITELKNTFGEYMSEHISLNSLPNYIYIKSKYPQLNSNTRQLQQQQQKEKPIYLRDIQVNSIPKESLDYLNKQMKSLLQNGKFQEDLQLQTFIKNSTTSQMYNYLTNNIEEDDEEEDDQSTTTNLTSSQVEKLKQTAKSLQSQFDIDLSFLDSIQVNARPIAAVTTPTPSTTTPIITSTPSTLTSNTINTPITPANNENDIDNDNIDVDILTTTSTSTTDKTTATKSKPKNIQQLLQENFEELCKLQLKQYTRNIPTPTSDELMIASNLHANIGKLGVELPPSMYIKSPEHIRQVITKSGLSVGSGRHPHPNFIQSRREENLQNELNQQQQQQQTSPSTSTNNNNNTNVSTTSSIANITAAE